jgi:hypothetical protein
MGPIMLDPCTTSDNPCFAQRWLSVDGLVQSWKAIAGLGLIYVNPPYGRELPPWVAKCCVEGRSFDCEIILLVPARTDTAWYDNANDSADVLCEWRGRLTFKGAPSPAPFPSAVFYWGPRPYLFCHVFQSHGRMRILREQRRCG